MPFSLDHVVIAVSDLDRAVSDYRSLGFTVHPGGVHHGGVSHNALIVFGDGSYFEIIAYRQDAPTNRWWKVLTTAGEGIVDFALLPENTERDIAAVRGRGLEIEGPIAGGRLRPDGVATEWQIARPATTDLPFWCGDVTPRNLRVPDGEVRRHPNGTTGISSVQIAAFDLNQSVERYRALVGQDAVRLNGGTGKVILGNTILELIGPDKPEVRRYLDARGEGVLSVSLLGLNSALDPNLLHGADLTSGN
jgi:catechol 2,3-dioxygenase-like lactoylglutathione lyase family enzyme